MKRIFILIILFGFGISYNSFAQLVFEIKRSEDITLGSQNLIAPKFAPNGKYIAASDETYDSIWIFNLDSKTWEKCVEEKGSGWNFDWSPDSKKIAFRSYKWENKRKKMSLGFLSINNNHIEEILLNERDLSTPKWITNDIIAFARNDQFNTISTLSKSLQKPNSNDLQNHVCLFSKNGYFTKISKEVAVIRKQLKGQLFNVSISPDGEKILFEKPNGNIYYLNETTNETIFLAEGEMASWSPDSKYIVYAITKNDGYKYLNSDLKICDLKGNNLRITNTVDDLEMRPHWAFDGSKIVYDDNGKIRILELESN